MQKPMYPNFIKFKSEISFFRSTINDINTESNYFKKKSRFLLSFNKKLFYKDIVINQITLSDYISKNKFPF